MKTRLKVFLLTAAAVLALNNCASSGAASAEEYFAIGMAYFEMGKFAEAETWLNKAKAKDKTLHASEYNLGRIAFETGRYETALKHFKAILKRDPNNVLALKAAAYTYIRDGNIEKAGELYKKILELVPESADDGYNYALVLFAMKKYEEAEQILNNHKFALLDNNDVMLLYARAQKEQGKPEAINSYEKWLANNTDAKVRYEYAQLLENQQQYARALDEYRAALTGFAADAVDPSKPEVRFVIARLLLIAEASSKNGITELKGAVDDGFSDSDKVSELLSNERISTANKEDIRTIIAEMKRVEAAAKAAEDAKAAEAAKAAEDLKAEEENREASQ
jgi:tetratricopeptide (TPR) repeat protein